MRDANFLCKNCGNKVLFSFIDDYAYSCNFCGAIMRLTPEGIVTEKNIIRKKDLFELRLHEMIENTQFSILRVPGGWIYCFKHTSSFVPLSREFAPGIGDPSSNLAKSDHPQEGASE